VKLGGIEGPAEVEPFQRAHETFIAVTEDLAAEFQAEMPWISDLDRSQTQIEGIVAFGSILKWDIWAIGKGFPRILPLKGKVQPVGHLPFETDTDAMEEPRVVRDRVLGSIKIVRFSRISPRARAWKFHLSAFLRPQGKGEKARGKNQARGGHHLGYVD